MEKTVHPIYVKAEQTYLKDLAHRIETQNQFHWTTLECWNHFLHQPSWRVNVSTLIPKPNKEIHQIASSEQGWTIPQTTKSLDCSQMSWTSGIFSFKRRTGKPDTLQSR